MEERRLKTILSHLSACPSQIGKSSVMNAASKSEKHTLFLPSTSHVHRKQQAILTPMSRSRSSSDIMESRLLGFTEEFPVRGDACSAVSCEELPSHTFASSIDHKCRGWKWSNSYRSEELEDCMCLRDMARTQTQGFDFTQGRSSKFLRHTFPPSGAAKFEWSGQRKSLHFKDELASSLEEKQIDSGCRIPFNQRQVSNAATLTFNGDHHPEIVHEPQITSRISDIMQNTDESDIQNFRDLHTLESQSSEVGNDVVGSISRNNVMTGQRRRIVDDCIFCLIIQGHSPAFKLYEDDMCVCILDVHPLSHGHSLLIPKTHFPSLELTPPEVAAAMCATVPLLSMAIMQATNCDSFNLLVNSGKAAGQVVFHTHFHIIPRRTGDNLWRSEDGNRRSLPVGHETALLVQQIRHNLSNKCL